MTKNESSTNNEIYIETTLSDDKEVLLQNVDLENFKNEMLQAMKREVQDLKRELVQYKEKVSNTNINK